MFQGITHTLPVGVILKNYKLLTSQPPLLPSVIGTFDDAENQNAMSVFVTGTHAFVSLSGGTDLISVDISTPSSSSLTGTLTLSGGSRDIIIIGNYAYIASASNAQELQVVNISNPASMTQVGSLDLSGTDNADTVSGTGTTILVGRVGGQVEVIDVSTPSSPTALGFYNIGGIVNDISISYASSTIAFVANDSATAEFAVIDFSTPSSPTLFGSDNQPNNLNGVWYDSNNDSVYVTSDEDGTEFIIFQPG